MYKDYLRSIEGIEVFPTIALIIFFTIFVGVLLGTFLLDKKYVQKMTELPFDGSNNSFNSGDNNG